MTEKPVLTQHQHFALSARRIAERDALMLEMLFGPNPITDEELKKLVEKRPERYGRYAGYIGKRKKNVPRKPLNKKPGP